MSQLGDTETEICVRSVEVYMSFALARPFADDFISDDLIKRVSNNDWIVGTTI